VVNISETLVDQNEEYDFAHLSFQEYLAAAEIVRLKQESLLYDKLGEDRWKAVILYYAGLVRNPSVLVKRILAQGNTALASECLQEARKVDAGVSEELKALKQAVSVDRYAQLATLLKEGKWEEADRETEKVMLEVAGQAERGFLMSDDFENFPCEDLRTIDRLWVEASNGHFGFSVQKKIWQDCGSPKSDGKDWDRFCVKVGWQDKQAKGYVAYSDLKSNPSLSPVGELPGTCMYRQCEWVAANIEGSLFSRAATCEL
jgi:predicted NACHT family NTPase